MEGIKKRTSASLGSLFLYNFNIPWSEGNILFINCSPLKKSLIVLERIASLTNFPIDIISKTPMSSYNLDNIKNEYHYSTSHLTENSFQPHQWKDFKTKYKTIIINTNENPRDSIHFLSYFNIWKLFFDCPKKTFLINQCYCIYNYYDFMGITTPININGNNEFLYFMVANNARQSFVDRISESKENGEIIEIGRSFGGSATAMALAAENKTIHSVDIETDSLFASFTSFYNVFHKIKCYNDGSYKTYLHWKKTHGQNLSFIFIDGDHREKAISMDIKNWSELLIPGGTICLHEYAHNDINQSTRVIFNEIISQPHKFYDFVSVNDLFYARKK